MTWWTWMWNPWFSSTFAMRLPPYAFPSKGRHIFMNVDPRNVGWKAMLNAQPWDNPFLCGLHKVEDLGHYQSNKATSCKYWCSCEHGMPWGRLAWLLTKVVKVADKDVFACVYEGKHDLPNILPNRDSSYVDDYAIHRWHLVACLWDEIGVDCVVCACSRLHL